MNIGDLILYAAFGVGSLAVLLLVADLVKGVPVGRFVRWLIRAFSVLLLIDMSLLTYYFVVSDVSVNYVWTYTSKYLPMLYKLSGALAGQQGTLLFWTFFIGIGSLWLNEKREANDFVKKTQIIVVLLGLFFIALTLKDSPFNTIYDVYPEIPADFLPEDGAGLNPLLIDPWMAVHPPIIFIAYATMAIPFAVAVVYLLKTIKGEPEPATHRDWVDSATLWCRISWLFLTLGIAIGGFWAYKVLGWGGFWAWDPVETSSLIPWILLTGALHALAEQRKKQSRYNILAPVLVALSFTLVIYATLVTRSGFFESVHAFGAGQTGFYILILMVASALIPLLLGVIKYIKSPQTSETEEEFVLVNRPNIFYAAILLFIILTFISLWGITFPALTKLALGKKVGMGISFFNIWNYPFIIFAMLLAGLGLNYSSTEKRRQMAEFAFFAAATVIAALIKPFETWKIVEYSAMVNSDRPFLYTLIGGASPLSILPPSIYLLWGASERIWQKMRAKSVDLKIKEVGVFVIHVGVVLIVAGSVVSTLFDKEFETTVKIGSPEVAKVVGTPYGVKLLGFEDVVEYVDGETTSETPSMGLTEFYAAIGQQDIYTVNGILEEIVQTDHNTYMKLSGEGSELWVASDKLDVPVGTRVVASGNLMFDFTSPALNRDFDVILFSPNIETSKTGPKIYSTAELVKVAVYDGKEKIGEGTAKSINYKNGEVRQVMIDRSLTQDVYVIYTGRNSQGIPLTIKIKPYINWVWLGVILFSVGILLITAFDPVTKRRRN